MHGQIPDRNTHYKCYNIVINGEGELWEQYNSYWQLAEMKMLAKEIIIIIIVIIFILD